MRNLKKNLISTFGFLLLIALTVAIYYLLPYEKLLMDKTTLFGVVVSEVITLLGTLFYNTVSGKKKLTGIVKKSAVEKSPKSEII